MNYVSSMKNYAKKFYSLFWKIGLFLGIIGLIIGNVVSNNIDLPSSCNEINRKPAHYFMFNSDGKLFSVPESSVQAALNNNWHFASEEELAKERQARRDECSEEKNSREKEYSTIGVLSGVCLAVAINFPYILLSIWFLFLSMIEQVGDATRGGRKKKYSVELIHKAENSNKE